MTNEVPVVGMGVTQGVGSDRYPFTVKCIVRTSKEDGNPVEIQVTADKYRRTDNNGLSESQSYIFSENPNAVPVTLTRRKKSIWQIKGHTLRCGYRWYIGERNAYQDPSF